MTLVLDVPTEPRWIDLPQGVRLLVRPVTTAIVTAAQARASREAKAMGEACAAPPDPDMARGAAFMLLCQSLARFAVAEWQGVHGPDGAALPLSPEALDALMTLDEMAMAFFAEAMRPVNQVAAEGNA